MYAMFLILVFTSSFIFVIVATMTAMSTREWRAKVVSGSIDITEKELAEPLDKRLQMMFAGIARNVRKRLELLGIGGDLERKLRVAGNPRGLDSDGFVALKLSAAGITAFLCIAGAVLAGSARGISLTFIATPIAFIIPDLWVSRIVSERKRSIRKALPDTLDLLTVSVEAGLGFDAALARVASEIDGRLADELRLMLREMQLGQARKEALRNLAERTDLPEVEGFVLAMIQADVLGISIGKVLRVQARQLRTRRRQEAEEMAMKAPVKMVFPLILCIFPALMTVILGPAVISIFEALFRNGL